jgi:hypothetical protein
MINDIAIKNNGGVSEIYAAIGDAFNGGILPERLAEEGELVPIQDISVLMGLTEKQESDLLNLNVK